MKICEIEKNKNPLEIKWKICEFEKNKSPFEIKWKFVNADLGPML